MTGVRVKASVEISRGEPKIRTATSYRCIQFLHPNVRIEGHDRFLSRHADTRKKKYLSYKKKVVKQTTKGRIKVCCVNSLQNVESPQKLVRTLCY